MQTLLIETSIHCSPSWIEQARKKVINQALDILGRTTSDHILFHNHEGEKLIRRYPLIQYRSHHHKLVIFVMGEAVPVVIKMIGEADPENPRHILNLNNVQLKKSKAEFKKSDKQEYYRLMDWIAFNSTNYNEKWQKSYTLLERVQLMNQAITGNLRFLADRFMPKEEWENIVGELYMLTSRKNQKAYGNTMIGFNVIFKTSYILPEHFALGRCVSLGAGTFQKLKNNPEVKTKKKRTFQNRKSKTEEAIPRSKVNENGELLEIL